MFTADFVKVIVFLLKEICWLFEEIYNTSNSNTCGWSWRKAY